MGGGISVAYNPDVKIRSDFSLLNYADSKNRKLTKTHLIDTLKQPISKGLQIYLFSLFRLTCAFPRKSYAYR